MRIEDYWIEELREVREFEIIANILNAEFVALNAKISELINNQFISSATESGLERRERILSIAPADDIEIRRMNILSSWSDKVPYTFNAVNQKLDTILGADNYETNLNGFDFNITFNINTKDKYSEVLKNLRTQIPANCTLSKDFVQPIDGSSYQGGVIHFGDDFNIRQV